MSNLSPPNSKQISVEEVKKTIDKNEKVILLDVRTEAEFSKSRIKGSINLPVDTVSSEITSVVPDKESKWKTKIQKCI